MSISKFVIFLTASQAFTVNAQDCQCYANGSWNEPICEGGDRPTIDLCLQDQKCHWGPDEFAKCQQEVEEYYDDIECQCMANGEENEPFCEGGTRPNTASCLYDDKCHWGPAEHPKCRKEVEEQLFHFENCQCFANKAWVDPFCDDANKPVHEICLQDYRCQWAPPIDLTEGYLRVINASNDEKCECFANGFWNEPTCENGNRPTIDTCLGDFRCHWGPGEFGNCQQEVKYFFGLQDDFFSYLPMNPMFQMFFTFAYQVFFFY